MIRFEKNILNQSLFPQNMVKSFCLRQRVQQEIFWKGNLLQEIFLKKTISPFNFFQNQIYFHLIT